MLESATAPLEGLLQVRGGGGAQQYLYQRFVCKQRPEAAAISMVILLP